MIQGQTGIRLPPRWIELNFTKRECAAFIGTPDDETVCYCGRRKLEHDEDILAHPQKGRRTEDWTPSKHTVQLPTDAYGQIIFEGEHHPNKSRFVRLSYDTNPDMVLQLMTLVWGIEMPKLVITVRGGNKDFELTPRLGKILQVGLLKAAKHTGAWIFTSGLNQGVTKHVGNALGNERWLGFKRGRCVGIGIAPWGVVENRVDLLGRNRDRTYNQLQRADSKFCLLNPRLSNLLLVDNGTVGKTGGDAAFRRRLERYMASYPMTPHRGCDTPVVCIVIEGGLYTLKVIAEYLHDDPPIPVVVLGHSGRTSDLLSYVMRKCEMAKDLDTVKDELQAILMSLYRITRAQCPVILNELRKIVSKKNLVTIYTPHQAEDEGFDTVILASIFRSQHWTPLQQLSLTLAWNRVDIATNEVFVYGRDWSREHLEHAMMEALVSDRLDFVNLLLEHGLNMQLFLTPVRLEGLYSLEKTQTNHMRSLLLELAKIRSTQQKFSGGLPTNKNLSLHEVGLAMSHMMGHIYQSKYVHLRVPSSDETSDKDAAMDEIGIHTFTQPFDDLFIWAVLTKRHSMALLLWSHGPGGLAKALVAVKLNRYFAEEMEQAETSNIAAEFQGYCEEWENISLELLDSCFRQDPQLARQLLTMELDHWSKQTCLILAVMGGHRMLLGHPCCQMLLVDLWMGALNIRHNVTTKIILGILCPFVLFCWDYKSTEELQLLPHQGRHELGLLNTTMTNADHNRFESESVRSNHSRSLTSVFPRSHPSTHDEVDKQKGDTVVNLSEVNVKLKEFKRNPIDNHPRQTHFHEKNHTILDSGAAGSFIFDNNSVLHKDGKDHRHHYAANAKNPVPDRGNARAMLPLSGFVTTKHELSMWNKFCEFQKAPITNFYRHTIAYLVFVCILAYVILVPQDKHNPGWLEIYVIAYVGSHGIDCIREMIAIDAYNWSQKWAEIRDEHIFVVADLFVSGFFMVGVGLRFASGKFFQYGVLLYRVSSIYYNLRLYKYMGVHRFVGPKIVMMSRMLKHMAYFAMIILVVLIAFGIARESIRFPNAHPTWQNIIEAFLEPYVMMFGEVDADSVSPHCGDGDDQQECPVGFWIIPLTWVVYMMVANILIVNVLIAVFNGIYSEVDAISLELWMFQRFNFVMEFEQKPLLPPPLIIIYHVYAIFKYFVQKCIVCVCESEIPIKGNDFEEGRVIMGNDHSLKTFLNPAEINIVFDFEEDNVDLLNSTNEHLIKLSERQKTSMIEPPTSGFVDKASLVRDGPLAHVKTHLRDITRELEAQRAKIDKILEMYEIANEEEGDDDEYATEPQPVSNAIPPSSATVSVQVPGQFMQTSPGVQGNQGTLGGEAGIVILGQQSAQHNPLHHSPYPVPQSQTHSGQRPPQNQNQQRPPQARK